MIHSFDIQFAEKNGLKEAILFQYIYNRQMSANKDDIKEGFTINQSRLFLPFWSERQTRDILDSLERKGFIFAETRGGMDRTKRYFIKG